jgi:hypothetical protein
MKWILILLIIPIPSFCQTVHIKDGRIIYEGTIKTTSASKLSLHEAFGDAEKNCYTKIKNLLVKEDSAANKLLVTSEMKLNVTQSTINTLRYTLKISAKDDGYKYNIDSVFLISKERGGKTKIISSEDLFKDMEVTGPVATQTEKTLNEIDMRIQQLLDLLARYLRT